MKHDGIFWGKGGPPTHWWEYVIGVALMLYVVFGLLSDHRYLDALLLPAIAGGVVLLALMYTRNKKEEKVREVDKQKLEDEWKIK